MEAEGAAACIAVGVRAQVVPPEGVSCRLHQDRPVGEPEDREPLDGGGAAEYPEADGADAAAIECHEGLACRTARRGVLGRCIDRDRRADDRQIGVRRDGVDPRAGDGEADGVSIGRRVGQVDGLPQCAVVGERRASVVGVVGRGVHHDLHGVGSRRGRYERDVCADQPGDQQRPPEPSPRCRRTSTGSRSTCIRVVVV